MSQQNQAYPFLNNSNIEKEAISLLDSYANFKKKQIVAPIPVFEIIEFLGYDIDFRKDGIYKDNNILGGLRIADKIVEINENISDNEGRMHFTAAHETGHIILHVPLYKKQKGIKEPVINEEIDMCRSDAGFDADKKDMAEFQADKFASYLLMPSSMVLKTFFSYYKKPVNVRKKSIKELFFPKPAFVKGYQIAEKILEKGRFDNVSKMAMLNRLIGLRLVKGLSYQKSKAMKQRSK